MRELLKQVRESAGAAAALAGLIGAVVYALLTFVCSLIYTPLGVDPSEVGLSYSALLIRTAVGVGGIAVLGMVAAAVALPLAWSVWALGLDRNSGPRRPPGLGKGRVAFVVAVFAVAGPALLCIPLGHAELTGGWVALFAVAMLMVPLSYGDFLGRRTRALVVITFVLVPGASLPVGLLVGGAHADAEDLTEGRRPQPVLGVPPPWGARVVRVRWAERPGPDLSLPRCLLFLGEANGTSVFYDARQGHESALRLPTSALLVEVLPNTRSSLPSPRRRGPCS
jgi:hypothetical protein